MTYVSAPRILRTAFQWAALLCLAFFVAACDSNDDNDGFESEGNRFIIQTTVDNPDDSRTSYVQLREDLNFDRLTVDDAIEIPGNGRLFLSSEDNTRFFTGLADSPVIQRYELSSEGSTTEGSAVSFANYGLSGVPFGNTFIDDDQAYLYNAVGSEFIIWNPEAMTVDGTIALGDARLDKGPFTPDLNPGVVRDDGLAFYLVFQHAFGGDFFSGIQVLIVDTETNTIQDIIEDERCIGGFSGTRMTDDGTVYVMGDNYVYRRIQNPDLQGSCILRINPGETEFDPDYILRTGDLNVVDEIDAGDGSGDDEETELSNCGGLEIIDGSRALTQCWNPDDADLSGNVFNIFGAQIASWYVIDLVAQDEAISLRDEVGLKDAGSTEAFPVENRAYLTAGAGRGGQNQLLRVDASGNVTPLFTADGLITNLGRVQAD